MALEVAAITEWTFFNEISVPDDVTELLVVSA